MTTQLASQPAAPEEDRGMTFEQWLEQNAERIWTVLRASERRDTSFNTLAEELWSQL